MTTDISTLLITAASLGFFHTILGPDHYLPFIAIAWARKWSVLKTAVITFLCGLGHIASSVVLGLVGAAFGMAVNKLELFESVRGNVAAWLLIAFGLAYSVWGLRIAFQRKSHTHHHVHLPGTIHEHHHDHASEHVHVHDDPQSPNITGWVLFIIFVFGPCEPLIPVLMYPAAKDSMPGVWLVTIVFGSVTIGTMLTVVLLSRAGISLLPMTRLQHYSHAIAGGTILLCGLAIQFLGM